MKKLFLLFAAMMLCILLSAQTQQGYVKTKGRMVNGNYVPGQGLKGATVSIKGKTTVLVNADDGGFSFPIPEKTFMVQRVQKNGYQLVDADMLKKPFNHSSNPIYLVMETPEQQMQDQLDSERKIRRTLMSQLQQKEDEIEGLKAQGKITQAQYQETMQKLYSDQENNEKLIAEMAKHYAQMDYDQMDELNQRISDAILNGRLTEADSMLRSKGSMSSRVAEIRKEQQTEAQRETEIAQEQKNLADAKAGTQMKLERIAEDCHMYFDLCKLNMEWDSAAYYIVLRAELDTANAEWQFDAAYYFQEQNNFSQAELYYSRCLKICQRLADDNPQAFGPYLANTENNLAVLYGNTQRLTESESLHLQALEIFQRLASDDPQTYEPDLAWTQSDLAVLYANTQRLAESERLYLQAVKTYRRLASDDPQGYQPNLASTLINLATLYKYTQRYTESERLYMEAIEIYQKLVDDNPQVYKPKLSWAMGLLAVLYSDLQRYTESEKVLLEVLETHKLLANDNPQAWEPSLAIALNDLASLYSRTQRLSESEKLYLESLEIYQRLADNNPQVYEPNLATTLNNLASIYEDTQHLSESERMYIDALTIRKRLANNNPQVYEPALANTLNHLAILYSCTQRLEESEKLFLEALEIRRRLAEANPQTFNPPLAATLHNLAVLYFHAQRFKESESMFEEAVEVYRRLTGDNPQAYQSDFASTLCYFGALKFVEGQYETATKHFEEALSIDPSQYWINPYLAISLLIQGKYTKAEAVYRQNKNELKDVFLQDLDHYEAAGIIPEEYKADAEHIRKMLKE